MKTLASFLFILVPLAAQDSTAPAGDSAKQAGPSQSASTSQSAPAQEAAKPAEKAADQPAPAAAAVATGEDWLKGSIELGYRWIPNISGDRDAYRSVVNLGEGPRLFDTNFTIVNRSRRFFDKADVQAASWGDPYNTVRADIEKAGAYRLTADYRNIAYFNFLPSYADPTFSRGIVLDQNAFDNHIRSTNVQLDLMPDKWITPYFAFGANTDFGRGVTVFHTDINEYPVASLNSDQTYNYRGGVRMEMGHYHFTLEQGGTTFKEDQGASDATPNKGNLTSLFFGKTLPLNLLDELYRVRGDSIYTKALLAANPYSWMSVSGQFVYSKPRTDINYTENSAGNFYLQRILQFYGTNQDLLTGSANAPHISGSLTVEMRPLRRLRIVQYWFTDRYHDASSALLAESFALTGTSLTDKQLLGDRLAVNSNQEEIDAYYDLTSKLTVRGGYRYEWGDASLRAPILLAVPLENGSLRRNVGIAGVNYRIGQKLRIVGDAEGSTSGHTYFRTSLQDYQKAHVRAQYDLSPAWRLAGDFSLLNNSNPNPSVKLDYSSKIESASALWTPKAGKWGTLLLDYARSALRSNILYLVPQTLSPTSSLYRENAHSLSMVATVRWLSLGGTMYISSGSRPAQYYQPLARLSVPVYHHVQWIAEWQWYSMAEAFYGFENFHSNQIITALRFTR